VQEAVEEGRAGARETEQEDEGVGGARRRLGSCSPIPLLFVVGRGRAVPATGGPPPARRKGPRLVTVPLGGGRLLPVQGGVAAAGRHPLGVGAALVDPPA